MLKIKRARKTTLRQYEIMLDFIESHPEMISGKITVTFSAQRREELWEKLSNLLNSHTFGPQKTPSKWRKTWIDIKCEAKQRERELIKQSQMEICLKPLPMPIHLARIKSLLAESNGVNVKNMKEKNDPNIKENNSADLDLIKIEECFEEESSPDTDVLNNENLELDIKANSVIKIENVTDILSESENATSFENIYHIPSTSTERPFEKNYLSTNDETPYEILSDFGITSIESSGEQLSNISSTSVNKSREKNVDYPLVCVKNPCENVLDSSTLSSNTPSGKNSNDCPKITKSPCEKVCDILTTSMKKLNDVMKNSENRTITAFNSLTKATVRANELQEKQILIEEERNRLYRERNEILFTLVNNFIGKKANHKC